MKPTDWLGNPFLDSTWLIEPLKMTFARFTWSTLIKSKAFSPLTFFFKNYFLILNIIRQQPPKLFYKKTVPNNFAKFTGKHMYWSLFLIKVHVWRPATLLKRLWHRCFPVNSARSFKSNFFSEHLWTTASGDAMQNFLL